MCPDLQIKQWTGSVDGSMYRLSLGRGCACSQSADGGAQSFLTLVPLALLLGEVTEDLAIRFGDVIGACSPARRDRMMARFA